MSGQPVRRQSRRAWGWHPLTDITFAGNIPLNDALGAAGPVDRIKDLAAVRADFESLWVTLNVAPTLTSVGTLGALAVAALRARG